MTANSEDRILTQKELAARWSLTVRTLQSWFSQGKGPKRVNIGKPGYLLSDVVQYEQEHAQAPGTRDEDQPKREFSDAFKAQTKQSKRSK